MRHHDLHACDLLINLSQCSTVADVSQKPATFQAGGAAMTSITTPKPLTQRILDARRTAREARSRGDTTTAQIWDETVDKLLDLLPRR